MARGNLKATIGLAIIALALVSYPRAPNNVI